MRSNTATGRIFKFRAKVSQISDNSFAIYLPEEYVNRLTSLGGFKDEFEGKIDIYKNTIYLVPIWNGTMEKKSIEEGSDLKDL